MEEQTWEKSRLQLVEFSSEPGALKYKQLAFAIAKDIDRGIVEVGDLMPSVSDYASLNNISNTTVIKAFALLKKHRLIDINASRRYVVISKEAFKLLDLPMEFAVVGGKRKWDIAVDEEKRRSNLL